MTDVPGLADVSDELYAGDPSDFVARRDALAREARDRKDRVLAVAIKKLRRPTVGAWYVNLAVRSGLTSLRELLRLGQEMRDAQAVLDFKRVVALGSQRADVERRVLSDLTTHLAGIGLTAAPAALEEVRSILRAAVADADATAAVLSGRLERSVESSGLAGFAAVPVPDAAAPEVGAEPDADAPEAEAERAASRAALEAARAERERAERERAERERAERERAERERAAALRALEDARQRLAAAETAAATARADHRRAAAEHVGAADRLSAAEAERAEAADAVGALERASQA